MSDQSKSATPEQLDILSHSLGIQNPRIKGKKPDRNYYCDANPSPKLEELCQMDLMYRGCPLNDGRDRYYHVTKVGAALVGVSEKEYEAI
jgi:hypothetical protein